MPHRSALAQPLLFEFPHVLILENQALSSHCHIAIADRRGISTIPFPFVEQRTLSPLPEREPYCVPITRVHLPVTLPLDFFPLSEADITILCPVPLLHPHPDPVP
jgi:hypothetical protein